MFGCFPKILIWSNLGRFSDAPSSKVKEITSFEGYFPGIDTSLSLTPPPGVKKQRKRNGNSILVKISKFEYIYIGDKVYSFTTKDEITHFYSPIGGNDVPYPVAYGSENVYFFLEAKKVSRDLFSIKLNKKNSQKVYLIFYGLLLPDGKERPPLKRTASKKEKEGHRIPSSKIMKVRRV